ncbi:Gp37-like protein [Actinomadura rubrisoli]|uniref:Gp28/Gp37-like domain-containing protein n=1 Tax=Actinomadura rubrisoli TaxID=2530368 RepID=A0A4R5CE36_9ACTN|nr:hypothetical protein [Actinomadura rubrisoli]TDD97176.1 hypothetical protein E1298_01705 [Actinomadura rubrisoli]
MDSEFRIDVLKLVNMGTLASPLWRWRRSGIVDSYTQLDCIVRYNAVGSWVLHMPLNAPQTALLVPGCRVAIWLPDMSLPVLSGPLRTIEREWSEDAPGPGVVRFSGVCDNTILAERLVWPNGDQGLTLGPDAAGYRQPFAYSGNNTLVSMERTLHELPYFNFGPGAYEPRREKGVYHLPPGAWPSPDSQPKTGWKLRFVPLLEALQARVESALDDVDGVIPMGFRWVWDPTIEQIRLQTFNPNQNPAGGVKFSKEIGNLRSYTYSINAPKANYFMMGLRNDDETHPEWQDLWIGDKRSETPEWGTHAEAYLDHTDISFYRRDGDDKIIWPHNPPQPGDKPSPDWDAINMALNSDAKENAATASLSVTPINTVGCRVGRDYWLGDRVHVEIDEEALTEVLREIHLSDGSDGPLIEPTIGTPDATETPAIYTDISRLWQAVTRLQRLQGGRK